MTKEEVNKLIMQACERTWNEKTCKEIFKALSQKPCEECKYKTFTELYFHTDPEMVEQEPCDDAISRETVIDTLQYAWEANKDIQESIVEIKALPSVTQKSGKWILQPSNKEQGERDFIWWKCSECGQVIYSETEKDRREYHAFCGRCGARMESEE